MLPERLSRTPSFALYRYALCLALSAVACSLAQNSAQAQTLDLSLNVLYADPMSSSSGGTWQLVGKSGGSGIAAVEALLTNVNLVSIQQAAPKGFVNGSDPAGFNEFLLVSQGGYTQVFVGQRTTFPTAGEQEGAFYGVGTLTNGSPNFPDRLPGTNFIGPNYTTLTSVSGVPWATGDVFSEPAWNTAAILATGTFAPGVMPGFFESGSLISNGIVFTSTGSVSSFGNTTLVDPVTSTIVRTNLMIAADYNENGIVDAADYTIWRDTLGSTTDLRADGSNNNMIDLDDYNIWKANFGSGAGAGSGAGVVSSVPEPAAGVLFMLAVAACGLARPTRNRR